MFLFKVQFVLLTTQYFSKNPNNALCIIHTCYSEWWHRSLIQVFHELWALSHLFFPKLHGDSPHSILAIKPWKDPTVLRQHSEVLLKCSCRNQHFLPCSIQCQFVMLVFSCTMNVYHRQLTPVLRPFLFLLAFVNTFHIINRENHCA